jgi:glycosyltransferase involved in cell wall biosynthesis
MKNYKHGLSVVLATYNEELNIKKCLDSIKDIASEIIVVDGSSTDNTVDIAKSFNAKVISTTNKPNFHINKNMAIKSASHEWTLQLDADEVVSPELAAEISHITYNLSPTTFNGYWMNRKNFFLTRFLTKGGQYPDPTLRLYRTGYGVLPEIDVHEQAKVNGDMGYLNNDLLHYRDTSFEKYFSGFNRYSSFIALQMKQKQLSINLLQTLKYLFIKPVYIFLNILIRHKGIVDGIPGTIFALFSGLVQAVAYMKYYQESKWV